MEDRREVGTIGGPTSTERIWGISIEKKLLWAHEKQMRRLIKKPAREFEIKVGPCGDLTAFDAGIGVTVNPGETIRVREVRGKK